MSDPHTPAGPSVEPVGPPGGPLWSVMIPTYNSPGYLEEALVSVLRQDPGPEAMQIEVVDDCSEKGDPEDVVSRVGRGRVSFYRQPANVGHTANFNTCIARARGHVVHILHDDDAVRPGFYECLGRAFRAQPIIGAACTRSIYADADGHWRSFSPVERHTAGILDNWLIRIASGQRLTTPAVAVRRSTYEAIGGFDARASIGEDWEMWVRIATRFPVWYEPQPLAIYRMNRPGSLTGGAQQTAALAQAMFQATNAVEAYLPTYLGTFRAEAALHRARRMYAQWMLEAAAAQAKVGAHGEALQALGHAWRTTRPWAFLKAAARALVTARAAVRRPRWR